MAIERVVSGVGLQLKLQNGVDHAGKPVMKSVSFPGVNPTATDQDLHEVGTALGGLQKLTLQAIVRSETQYLQQR